MILIHFLHKPPLLLSYIIQLLSVHVSINLNKQLDTGGAIASNLNFIFIF